MNPTAEQQLPLRDIHLPAEPGLWPPAPGWWLLATILLALLVWFSIRWYQRRQRQKQWRTMRQLWHNIQQDHQSHGDDSKLARDLSNLLRRFVRHQLKNPQAAGLSGEQWVVFLNKGLKEPVFDQFSNTLNSGLYQQQHDYQTQALLQAVHQFLKHHCLQPKRSQS